MPDVHAGPPGRAMTLHISFGLTFAAACLAYHLSCGAGEFSTAVAASFLGSCPLATLCTGSHCNHHRLAVRIVPGVVGLLFRSHPIADAGGKKHSCDPPD